MNILLSVLTVYLSIGFGVALTITRVVFGMGKDRSWKVVAFMFTEGIHYKTPEAAAKAWNGRANERTD